jgi:hypothetical protein
VLAPLLTLGRGLHRLAVAAHRLWKATPKEGRGPLLFLVGSVVLTVLLVPYGVPLALVTLTGAAVLQGRRHARAARSDPDDSQVRRLRALYEALVPYFSGAEDPSPLYAIGGAWEKAFACYEFDADGRLSRLVVRYPAYFADGEATVRVRVERVVHAKSGRGREYRFEWDEEDNELTVILLSPLPTGIPAQRFRTAPGETVLGFTDPADVRGLPPVADGEGSCDLPAVVWRTGPRGTEPHLLAVGRPGSGASTLLRSLALQALAHGDVLIVDGSGTGEYACLKGRTGVLAVESGLNGALAGLEWAAHETRRRLIAAARARQAGHPPAEDTKRPLWVLLDRPGLLCDLAAADGRPDPQTLLQVPLRQGRAAGVTVVVAEQFDALDGLGENVRQYTRARVVLGPAPPERIEAVLGTSPHTTPTALMPPGRGYARLGTGPVLRLQVPATPDPYDDTASAAHRQAVLDLLPDQAAGETAPAAPSPAADPHGPTPSHEPAPPRDATASGTPVAPESSTARETPAPAPYPARSGPCAAARPGGQHTAPAPDDMARPVTDPASAAKTPPASPVSPVQVLTPLTGDLRGGPRRAPLTSTAGPFRRRLLAMLHGAAGGASRSR